MKKGIDVSHWNGTLDWARIRDGGIQFALIRAGCGQGAVDSRWDANASGAQGAGLPMGAYWFSYALSEAQARQEARACLSVLGGRDLALPIFYDFENASVDYAREQGVILGRAQYNAFAQAFCEEIQAQGLRAGIYYNLDYYRTFVDEARLGDYQQWIAQYTQAPPALSWDFWQCSDHGSIPGCPGPVDVDYAQFETEQQEEPMSGEEIYRLLQAYLSRQTVPDWAAEEWEEAIRLGITDGASPMELTPRYQAAILAKRAAKQA